MLAFQMADLGLFLGHAHLIENPFLHLFMPILRITTLAAWLS